MGWQYCGLCTRRLNHGGYANESSQRSLIMSFIFWFVDLFEGLIPLITIAMEL